MSFQKDLEELNLNSAITDLASRLEKEGIKFDDKNVCTIEANDENGLLPEGVDLKQIKKLDRHVSSLISAGALSLAKEGPKFLKKNKDAESAGLVIKYGNNKVELNMKRSADIRNVATGEVHTAYGVISAKYRAYGSNGSSGSLKAIRSFASKAAEAILK